MKANVEDVRKIPAAEVKIPLDVEKRFKRYT